MLVRYDEIHHYDKPNPYDLFDRGIPVYEEEALWPDYGYKRIVSVEHFVLKMLQEVDGVKYLYDSTIEGRLLAVSHKYWIKCEESPNDVLDRFKEALNYLGYVHHSKS